MEYFLTSKLYLLKNPDIAWITFAVFLFFVEIFFARGIGVIFLSFGALTTGLTMYFKVLNFATLEFQVISFFIFSAFWSIVLWRRVRTKSDIPSINLIGKKAMVDSRALRKNKTGNIIVGGEKYKARISPSSKVDRIEPGTDVWIHDMDGKIMLVGRMPDAATTARDL